MIQSITHKVILLCLLVYGSITVCVAQSYTIETVPNPKQSRSSHYVSNPDKILSDFAVQRIDQILGQLEDSTTVQVAVVCVNSIGEAVPKDFATALFRKWELGYKNKNNGLLVLLVKDQRRLEMETGYGLEGILPDAICRRIQTEKMVPRLKEGDFDGALIDGVKEVAQLISEPEAAKEVYDESKYSASTSDEPLTNSGLMAFFLLLIPTLLVLRTITFFLRSSNPISLQIQTSITQTKGRWAWIFLLYVILPIALGFAVVEVRQSLSLQGWQILLIMYTYIGVVLWDGRRRRKKAFTKLYGSMTEPERYVRQKVAGLNGWGNILLFPIPFGWLRSQDDQAMKTLRNRPRQSANGYELTKVEASRKGEFLTDHQKVEERLKTMEYDVWRNETHDVTQTIGYEDFGNTTYQRCNKCGSRAMHLVRNRTVKEATEDREGRGVKEYECEACGHHRDASYMIAVRKRRTASDYSSTTYSSSGSSSSWSSSSSSSYSSSSSWGGGSSGGGGAGSSW
ncbi:hypothetical protein GCM10028805_31110 [Spirosoma harenae]